MAKKYYLSVLAIFKNECHILDEWLNAHMKEGVEHFYLINNDSTDDYADVIDRHSDHVTLIHIQGQGKQLEAYNSYTEQIIAETEWIALIDLDEFIFSTEKNTKFVDFVKEYENNGAEGIYLPWIMYGSSNFKKQPNSVIDNFLNRKSYDYEGAYVGGKSIAKTDKMLNNFSRHHLINIKDNNKYVNENGIFNSNEWFGECPDMYMSESKVENMKLRINHYAIQSYEYFMNVKVTRGDVLSTDCNIRDNNYFIGYDTNEVFDDILKLKNS